MWTIDARAHPGPFGTAPFCPRSAQSERIPAPSKPYSPKRVCPSFELKVCADRLRFLSLNYRSVCDGSFCHRTALPPSSLRVVTSRSRSRPMARPNFGRSELSRRWRSDFERLQSESPRRRSASDAPARDLKRLPCPVQHPSFAPPVRSARTQSLRHSSPPRLRSRAPFEPRPLPRAIAMPGLAVVRHHPTCAPESRPPRPMFNGASASLRPLPAVAHRPPPPPASEPRHGAVAHRPPPPPASATSDLGPPASGRAAPSGRRGLPPLINHLCGNIRSAIV
jgi:hypothetical protein